MFNRDYRLVISIGFVVGVLIFIPLKNIGIHISPPLFFASIIGFTVFAPCAFFILRLLSRYWPVFEQFGKFAAVGTLNALINLSVLNALVFFTNITQGIYFSAFASLAFIISKVSSYLWNKFWTFESKTKITMKEYAHFTVFTLAGMALNVGIISLLVSWVGAPYGISPKVWINISALIAVVVTMTWNFLTYQRIVFKEKERI